MKPTTGKLRRSTRTAVAAFLALGLALPTVAKENRRGAEVLVQKKDGQMVKAELLAVKDGRLILMDSSTFSDLTCSLDDIRSIRVVKKAKVLKGLGLGILTGAAAGSGLGLLSGDDESGFLRFTAGQKALLLGAALAAIGGTVGGVSGALIGVDQSADLEGRSPQEIAGILRKLDKQAHFPQGLLRDNSSLIPESTKEEGKRSGGAEVSLPGLTRTASPSFQERGREKFSGQG